MYKNINDLSRDIVKTALLLDREAAVSKIEKMISRWVGGFTMIDRKKRYPPHGYYFNVLCTCSNECQLDCKGECGCQACKQSYNDFLSL